MFTSRPQSPSFLGHVVGKIKASASGGENALMQTLLSPNQSARTTLNNKRENKGK